MNMQAVITKEQAKAITGGRTPLVPVEYESAVKALAACVSLDEAKYWSDKSDALAAWAKIYKDDQAGVEARRLKLHAYRRMGQLAGELQPTKFKNQKGSTAKGKFPGPVSLLQERGLTRDAAQSARHLALRSPASFASLVSLPKPPAPSEAKRNGQDHEYGGLRAALFSARSHTRKFKAAKVARSLQGTEVSTARMLVRELIDWLDEFEQHLPK